MDKRPKYKSYNYKILEENEEKLHDIGYGNEFLDMKREK